MRLIEFHRYLSEENTLRVRFEVERGQVLRFMVQLECWFDKSEAWAPVIRYDTAHGFAHCDRLHPYEETAKTRMTTEGYGEALTFAINDLVNNWGEYRKRYEEWLKEK